MKNLKTYLFIAILLIANSLAASSFDTLAKKLQAAAAGSPGNSTVSITITDIYSKTVIFSKNPDKLLNPASNAKIPTAACALFLLKPEFRYLTSIHGEKKGSMVYGNLYLKGQGDPSLSMSHLREMAFKLKSDGINRINGSVVVDDSYFDDDYLPFAYDQQSGEDAVFRAPIGGASVNYNTVEISIRLGHQAMRSAIVRVFPSGYAVIKNDTITVGRGAFNPKLHSKTQGNRMWIRAWGTVPLGNEKVTFRKRAASPPYLTGYSLKSALEQSGISVGGKVNKGVLPPGTPMLASHTSKPLSEILFKAGKNSNNFVTETVLKTIGAESSKSRGTWENSIEAVTGVLEKWGLKKDSYVYKNGSGLFDANRFSSRQMVKILTSAYLDSALRTEFTSQLATGGADGTIKSRYGDPGVKRMVRAKTGTLNSVSALSGYVFDKQGRRPIAFSILINNAAGYVSASRNYQEKIVTIIAKFLNDTSSGK